VRQRVTSWVRLSIPPCIKTGRDTLFECAVRAFVPTLLVWIALMMQGCASTQFYERERLNDRAMQFDQDGGVNYVRSKIEAAREGSLGGFGSAEAGGCGCQ
jgi:hypothetical protein